MQQERAEAKIEGKLDGDGFLKDAQAWNWDLARELAEVNQLGPLTPDHWKIIVYVRDYFLEQGQGPPVVKIARATGLSAGRICSLFPCGIAKGAYRLAGLPRPVGCL